VTRLRSPSRVAGRTGRPSTTPNPHPVDRRRHWLRRPATWLLTVVAGAIALLVTQIVSGLPAQLINPNWVKDLFRPGPDLVVAAQIIDRDENGFSMAVPQDYQPNPKFLTMQEIRVLDISPVIIKRTDPLGGSAFLFPGQGESDNVEMVIDFDALVPIARESGDEANSGEPHLGEPYFDRHKITLGDNEQEVITMPIRVTRYYVEFDLKFDYLVGTEKKSLVVDNDGQHFRVTGIRTGPDPDSLPYQRVYIMRGDFSICPIENPSQMSLGQSKCWDR
jgi:hypothetical protein